MYSQEEEKEEKRTLQEEKMEDLHSQQQKTKSCINGGDWGQKRCEQLHFLLFLDPVKRTVYLEKCQCDEHLSTASFVHSSHLDDEENADEDCPISWSQHDEDLQRSEFYTEQLGNSRAKFRRNGRKTKSHSLAQRIRCQGMARTLSGTNGIKCGKKSKRGKSQYLQIKASEVKRRTKRQEEAQTQIIARKERIHRRIEKNGGYCVRFLRSAPDSTVAKDYRGNNRTANTKHHPDLSYHSTAGQWEDATGFVLSADALGLENSALYDRLLQILQGDEISPEDFDLLLQLDTKNHKKTLQV